MLDLKFRNSWLDVDAFHNEINGSIELEWKEEDKLKLQTLALDQIFENLIIETRIRAGLEIELLSDWDYELACGLVAYDFHLVKKIPDDKFNKLTSEFTELKKVFENAKEAGKILSPIKEGVESIIKTFSLNRRWEKTLEVFIATGESIPPKNAVEVKLFPISDISVIDGKKYYHTPPEGVAILLREHISKTAFGDILTDIWPEVEKLFKELSNTQTPSLTERDFYIMDLKDEQDYSFNDIADAVIAKYNINEEREQARINAGSMKTAYHTAKKKLKLISQKSSEKLIEFKNTKLMPSLERGKILTKLIKLPLDK